MSRTVSPSRRSGTFQNTKTLRNVAKKARKHGRGRRMASDDDESSAEEFDEAEAADSYNSSDSDVSTSWLTHI